MKYIYCKFFLHSQSVFNQNGSHTHWRKWFHIVRILPSFQQWVCIMCLYLKQCACILHYGMCLCIALLLKHAMCLYNVFEYLAIYMYTCLYVTSGGEQCFHRMLPSCNLSVWATLQFLLQAKLPSEHLYTSTMELPPSAHKGNVRNTASAILYITWRNNYKQAKYLKTQNVLSILIDIRHCAISLLGQISKRHLYVIWCRKSPSASFLMPSALCNQ